MCQRRRNSNDARKGFKKAERMKNVFLIGTGLIGGSMLLDLREHFKDATFYGIDQNEAHAQRAAENGMVDEVATMEDLKLADLVLISIPVDAALSVVPQVLDLIPEHALVIDVGSTKEAICNAVEGHKNRRQFLAAHPIAGTEFLVLMLRFMGCLIRNHDCMRSGKDSI